MADVVVLSEGALSTQRGVVTVPAVNLGNVPQSATSAAVNVKASYGVKGDSVSDDTAAIANAISTEYAAGVADGTYYRELYFPLGVYLLSGATTKTSTNKGNSQLPLPVVPVAGRKFTLVLRGSFNGSAMPYFSNVQTVAQTSGVVFKSTISPPNDVTWGEPSVIGGPTPAQGYGGGGSLFSNLLVVIAGIQISLPNNPTISGVDFRGVANAHVGTLAILPQVDAHSLTEPTNTFQFGLAMPHVNNNVTSIVESLSVYGCYFAFQPSEHTYAQAIRCIYNEVGICFAGGGGSSTPHGCVIVHASIEGCVTGLMFTGSANPAKISVLMLDWESNGPGGPAGFGTFHHIHDPSNFGVGEVGIRNVTPDVNGASFLRVTNVDQARGHVTAPAVPATTVALQNPFWLDAAVTVSIGTVTAIAVDGTATGITSGTVIVPSGKTITLTYSVAPSWNWVLL